MDIDALLADGPHDADALVIGGYERFSTVDWPGKLVATLFLQGCPWECTYCHNPALQDSRGRPEATWAEVREHLSTRIGRLDGVVFSGGEPTRQNALIPAMREVREMGFLVGMHSAGAYPGRLEAALPHVDWLGLDIKATPERYGAVTGVGVSGQRAWMSLDIALAWGGPLEVRLTVDPTVHRRADVLATIAGLRQRGVQPVIQEVRATGATPEYAARLAGRRLTDVVEPGDLVGLTVR